ncbi:Anterior gradient protein 2-like [Acipenser ruthenus]|uniref:Anterior gradient protein 2-like n=1 Tax=Acipenser ruthenus TaxID=7906 RepID=A0A444UPY5_ACIRT|nr:Anterior gradient protein 2-like [Acipenser ruthenus]
MVRGGGSGSNLNTFHYCLTSINIPFVIFVLFLYNCKSYPLFYISLTPIECSFIKITGWGDELNWTQTYEEALFRAKSSNKPLMVIHHLEDCPHSQAMKQIFANNKEIQKMAGEDFILLNLVFETSDKHLAPDGQYVPRFIFVGYKKQQHLVMLQGTNQSDYCHKEEEYPDSDNSAHDLEAGNKAEPLSPSSNPNHQQTHHLQEQRHISLTISKLLQVTDTVHILDIAL